MASYDLVVIGTGPGGYVCAIRAAQLGLKVAVVEKSATRSAAPASTSAACRRRRCCTPPKCSRRPGIPSPRWAIGVSTPKLDLPAMMDFKQQGIDGNVKGVEFLMKKNKIDVLRGTGKVLGTGKVEVTGADGKAQTRRGQERS